ncbi:hypothetical protein EJ04DRAFT_512608 [Polyplosphaeria fusca]|uniref:Uncharacterized protein n=1 Tax=Polyplosphaeria fusca TaxID=682080 RepID=A0A9P4QZC4_9PLEO|nr:hypothetical protein EJ04DRAFT_512608 [Polyplosphaeria fusca]
MPTQEEIDHFNKSYRQVKRRQARGVLGATTSTLMTPVLPYMAAPAGVAVYAVHKADKARDQLAEQEKLGFRPRKRDALRAVTQAGVEKMILIPLTLGHDEWVLGAHALGASYDASATVAHEALTHVPILGDINEAVNIPMDAIQGEVGLENAGERIQDIAQTGVDAGGWHDAGMDPGAFVAAGATAAAVEYVVDRPFAYPDERKQTGRR